jgi:hypothetical protein
MKKTKGSPLMILIYGTAAALVIFAFAFFVMDREQCPPNYTQAQVDASGCIIGANIGLGFSYLLGLAIWFVCLMVALSYFVAARRKKS